MDEDSKQSLFLSPDQIWEEYPKGFWDIKDLNFDLKGIFWTFSAALFIGINTSPCLVYS